MSATPLPTKRRAASSKRLAPNSSASSRSPITTVRAAPKNGASRGRAGCGGSCSRAGQSGGAGGRIVPPFVSRTYPARSAISDPGGSSQEQRAVVVERRACRPFRNDRGYFNEILDGRFVG